MKRLVEFRCYKLKPGAGNEFHLLIANRAVQLMRDCGMDVVAFGQSAQNPDDYLLLRAYENLEQVLQLQEDFYASEPWRNGPREAIVALVESNVNTVVWLPPEVIEGIRASILSSQA